MRQYQKTGFNLSVQDNYNWLKSKEYEYLIIDGQTMIKLQQASDFLF